MPLAASDLPTFLRAVFGDDAGKAYVAGFTSPPDSFDSSTEAGRKASARAWAGREYASGGDKLIGDALNNYLCISTFSKAKDGKIRRRRECHAKTHAIMVDDVDQKVDRARLVIPPTFEVRTSEKSTQAWYVLSKPCEDAEQVDAVVNALVADGLAAATDPGMKGVTRYGRLPFGVNNKAAYGTPWVVRCVGDWMRGPRYSLEEFVAAFHLKVTRPTPAIRASAVPEGIAELEAATLQALQAEGLCPHGPLGDSKRYSLKSCPWAAEHTSGTGDGHYYAPGEGNAYNGGYKCFHGHCINKRGIRDLTAWLREKGHDIPEPKRRLRFDDFLYIAPQNSYLCLPTGELWREEAIDKSLPFVPVMRQKKDKTGQLTLVEELVRPSRHIAKMAMVSQMTWMPGHEKVIDNAVLDENGAFDTRGGMRIANLYTAPRIHPGKPTKAKPWCDHIRRLYPAEADFVIAWFAHRVQRPFEKINWAIVMGGPPGIGKDSIIEPVVWTVGVSNVKEIGPTDLWTDFNDYLQAVMIRVSESHDLGEHSRHAFYERTKRILAVPPHVFDINSKYARKYRIRNIASVIFTSNHEGGGLYIPDDDRRYFVLWTEVTQADFPAYYFRDLWLWYQDEGFRHVAAFLREYDLTSFNPKGNPPKTESFMRVALSNQRPENNTFRQVVEELGRRIPAEQRGVDGWPLVLTFDQVTSSGVTWGYMSDEFLRPVMGKGRVISEIMRDVGYQAVLKHPPGTNAPSVKREQRWKVRGRLQTIYGRLGANDSSVRSAASHLARETDEKYRS